MSHLSLRKILLPVLALVVAGGLLLAQTSTTPAGQPQIEEFVAEAAIPLNFVLSPAPPNIPADVLARLQAGTLQARQRVTYNPAQNILTVWIFTAGPNDALPSPVSALPPALPPRTISLFQISPEVILQSSSPTPNLLFAGRVTGNSVTSPFGNLNGATAAVSVGYDPANAGRFTLLGGTVAGSNVTFSPSGQGTLRFAATSGGGTTPPPGGTPGNRAPTVEITPLPSVVTIGIIELDASRSTDADGDPLTFQWRSIGRQAAISNANSAKAQVQFSGEIGEYTFEVTVSDNKGNSSTSRVTVTYLGR